MKATIEVPDELYRQLKAKSALEGRAVREVAVELFRRYVNPEAPPPRRPVDSANEPLPSWFGRLGGRPRPKGAEGDDLDSIRRSIAAGIARERSL